MAKAARPNAMTAEILILKLEGLLRRVEKLKNVEYQAQLNIDVKERKECPAREVVVT
jgi:hypothetical protein